MNLDLVTTYTLIICVLLICKYFKNDGFSTIGVILLLSGFGALILLRSIGGFMDPAGTAHRVMGNIGNICGAGLLIAALFTEMLSSSDASSSSQSAGPPPPQF